MKLHTAQEAADGKPRQNKGNSKRNRNNIDLSLYLQKNRESRSFCAKSEFSGLFQTKARQLTIMFKILIAEDDIELRQLFYRVLTLHGYSAICVSDGKEALDVLDKEYVDLIISDIMMPNMNGYELASSLRESGITIPILMITAKDSFVDMQMGFASGTDDYMVKPVNVNEMVLRVGALLRRAQMISDRRQTIGNTVLEYDSMTVTANGKSMVLPQKEFMLLYKLTAYPGRIFTRQQLMDDIWGLDSETEPRTVDVHINRLRDRFRDNDDFEIITIRGLGYKAVKRHGA